MSYYLVLCVVLLNLVLISKLWLHKTKEDLCSQEYEREIRRRGNFHNSKDQTAKKHKYKKEDIVFPDVTTGVTVSTNDRAAFTINYSAARKGTNCIEDVCTDAKDYPYEHIEEIGDKLKDYDKFFGFTEGAIVKTSTRFPGPGQDSATLCASTIRTVFPKTLKNENSAERFIINTEGNKQGLAYETCVEKAKCRFASLFPNDYVTKCTQKFTKIRLMALGEDGNPAFDTFVIPSHCVCTIEQVKTK